MASRLRNAGINDTAGDLKNIPSNSHSFVRSYEREILLKLLKFESLRPFLPVEKKVFGGA